MKITAYGNNNTKNDIKAASCFVFSFVFVFLLFCFIERPGHLQGGQGTYREDWVPTGRGLGAYGGRPGHPQGGLGTYGGRPGHLQEGLDTYRERPEHLQGEAWEPTGRGLGTDRERPGHLQVTLKEK